MTDYLLLYMNELDIDIKKAEKRRLMPTENGTRTAAKEMIGEMIIKKYRLFDWILPDNLGYKKITDKKLQKSGVDYIVYTEEGEVYIDLKSCVGPDFSMKKEDFDQIEVSEDLLSRKGLPIEIYQNDIFTNTAGKLTDIMLYTICDKDGISYYALPYEEVRHFSLLHKTEYIVDKESGIATAKRHYPFTRYTSRNLSGLFAKKPVYVTKLI